MTQTKDTYDRKTFSRQEWKEYVLESALPFDIAGLSSDVHGSYSSQSKRPCPEASIPHLLLNYFVVMSYEEASIRMARELGYVTTNKEAFTFNQIYKISERAHVRELIKKGRILEAIEEIYTKFGVQVLEPPNTGIPTAAGSTRAGNGDDLHFKLLLLNLIEMIRKHHQSGASPEESSDFILELIEYSQERLALKADSNKQYMKELELVMTLLLFPMEKTSAPDSKMPLPKSLRNLYSLSLRTKIADLVNRKLLQSMHGQISSATSNGEFPDLIGSDPFPQALHSYTGIFQSSNSEEAGFEYAASKNAESQQRSRSSTVGKPWKENAWKATNELLKQQDQDMRCESENNGASSECCKQLEYEAKLNQVIKLWAWCENQLHNCGVGVPRVEGGA
ncbi:LADA_0E02344g1_1 [Lachancea dasiensis]|uniref:LADA_0E02344g1_1 n=1 Tax=Lachancea dasiensis TaxID=1072105 RepID=A0A1G4JAW2_9SACH|nr:LADA_0E02344g1_1 [Lachancea dasiensis]